MHPQFALELYICIHTLLLSFTMHSPFVYTLTLSTYHLHKGSLEQQKLQFFTNNINQYDNRFQISSTNKMCESKCANNALDSIQTLKCADVLDSIHTVNGHRKQLRIQSTNKTVFFV